jgi:CheY-like chemotaxis protein/Asp-tRNA(Asn)/Glu-tRNA(Gln) amidotransferase C subunit
MNNSGNNPDPQATNAAADESNALEIERLAHRAFRANLNHKLRTPLNAILGYAELLALRPNGREKDADVQQILRSARELLQVIESELRDSDDEGTTQRTAQSEPPKRDCDVLYVEDDPVNFTLVERILEYRPDLSVLHAPHGRRGIEMANALAPKLILLDLNLPDMHGSEVLQRLQQEPSTAGIPVVILSANATPSQIERLLSAGAKNYLTKPFNIEPFLAVVDEFTA